MPTPILPHIAIKPTRLCDGDDDVNCFSDLQGCQTSIPDLSSGIMCGDDGEWSISLRFVGNGVWLTTGTTCLDDTCKWTIDDDESSEGCTDWVPQELPGHIGRQSIIHATGLDGSDDTKHTLTISSLSVSASDGPHLYLYDTALIYTGPDTPVHPGDFIGISPHYSEVKVEGKWSAAVELDGRISEERIHEDLVGSWRLFEGGEGFLSVGIVGDAFDMPLFYAHQGDDADPNTDIPVTMNVTVNGEDAGDRVDGDTGIIPLDPGGWYNVGFNLSFPPDVGMEYMSISNIIYHPLDNITRIRDIIPEALVGRFNDSPPSSNNLGCAVESEPGTDSGAGESYLRESTGAFFLLPMILMWSILRLKF